MILTAEVSPKQAFAILNLRQKDLSKKLLLNCCASLF